MPLTLRPIGQNDYNVHEGGQRIGRIRYAKERTPGVWIWNVQVHLGSLLPMGTTNSLDDAKAEFKAGWEALKARTDPDKMAEAFKAMNIRDDG